MSTDAAKQGLNLYLSQEHACAYIEGKTVTSLVPDPNIPMSTELYSQLIQLGYRRSGGYTYRPHCTDCSACNPCRVRINDATFSRSQQRCLKANADLTLSVASARYSDEYFDLYARYLNTRHGDGNMSNPEPADFENFLYCNWSRTIFIEARLKNKLIVVAVADYVDSGLSAVYSFFDPLYAKRGLGTFSILQQIKLAGLQQRPYLYLGYWIEECSKMSYKNRYKPIEVFRDNQWISLE